MVRCFIWVELFRPESLGINRAPDSPASLLPTSRRAGGPMIVRVCSCGAGSVFLPPRHASHRIEEEHFHWVNSEPVGASRKFTISPADISYSSGNYWQPSLRGGLAAPQDSGAPWPIGFGLSCRADFAAFCAFMGRMSRGPSRSGRQEGLSRASLS